VFSASFSVLFRKPLLKTVTKLFFSSPLAFDRFRRSLPLSFAGFIEEVNKRKTLKSYKESKVTNYECCGYVAVL
jgi:hypothetical protein